MSPPAKPYVYLPIDWAGERWHACGERALFWPARRRLLLADLHLGKGDIFRRAGLALPQGGTAADLSRLGGLITQTGAQSVWILGDMLHGAVKDAPWLNSWQAWREQHGHVEIAVLTGNHDRALQQTPLGITQLGEVAQEGGLSFQHMPAPDQTTSSTKNPRHAVLCGHIHPVVQLPGVPRRWPAFWLRPHTLVLPAFSQFTGGQKIKATAGEQLIACVEGTPIVVPASRN